MTCEDTGSAYWDRAELLADNKRLREALSSIRGGSFHGADTLAVSGAWKLFVERLQKIAASALADTGGAG